MEKKIFFCITKIILVLRPTNAMIWKKSKNLGLLNVSSLFIFVGKEDYSRATVLLLLHSLPLQGLFRKSRFSRWWSSSFFWVACQILGKIFQFIFGEKKFIIAASVPDQDPEQDPEDAYVFVRIQGSDTGSVSKCHGSGTLVAAAMRYSRIPWTTVDNVIVSLELNRYPTDYQKYANKMSKERGRWGG